MNGIRPEHLQRKIDQAQQDIRRLQVSGLRTIDGPPKPTEGNQGDQVIWMKGREMRFSIRMGGKWWHFKPSEEA